jgi:hypothetical protein
VDQISFSNVGSSGPSDRHAVAQKTTFTVVHCKTNLLVRLTTYLQTHLDAIRGSNGQTCVHWAAIIRTACGTNTCTKHVAHSESDCVDDRCS